MEDELTRGWNMSHRLVRKWIKVQSMRQNQLNQNAAPAINRTIIRNEMTTRGKNRRFNAPRRSRSFCLRVCEARRYRRAKPPLHSVVDRSKPLPRSQHSPHTAP